MCKYLHLQVYSGGSVGVCTLEVLVIFVLFFVSKSAAMLARSLPVLGGKMLVHDVAYASTTYAELVHSVIQTYCQAQSDST